MRDLFASMKAAYVTLLTKNEYLPGVLVLDHCLKRVNSKYPLVVMITDDLPSEARDLLDRCGIQTHTVESLMPSDNPARKKHTVSESDARFTATWIKLRCFGLIQYDRLVMLDSDMIVQRNMDELMHLELEDGVIAAAHACACNPRKFKHYPADWIPANCAHTAVKAPLDPPPVPSESSPRPYSQLNSGTLVLNPSQETSDAIIEFLHTTDQLHTFGFPDQDLLTAFYGGKWKVLPWYYNALKTLKFIHPEEWDDTQVRCLHYILPEKPWEERILPEGTGSQYDGLHQLWWDQFHALGQGLEPTDPDGWNFLLSLVGKKSRRHPK